MFYNTTLAPDEVDRLLFPKVMTSAKRYSYDGNFDLMNNPTGNGKCKCKIATSFNNNKDNLIVKGNNLLALSSLLRKYEGMVKCIYIDPPYNTGSDSFGYNDTFNHSTWLTFMKNRLLLAKNYCQKTV